MCVHIYRGMCANAMPNSYTCTYFKDGLHGNIKHESMFITRTPARK